MLIVQKFGGTSMANPQRMALSALKVQKEIERGNKVIVVVSAMSGETDKLLELCKESAAATSQTSTQETSSHQPSSKEMDAEIDSIASTGEQVSAGLMSIILQNMGIKSRSCTGWQVPIETDHAHSKARVEDINHNFLDSLLSQGITPVICGFQGICKSTNRITTLGRGGSDTSAIAVAAATKADRCDIYTDVTGVFTADPRVVKNARKLKQISYEEMLEMASAGSKVLQVRSVEMAMKYSVPTVVLSSFIDEEGTLLTKESKSMEKYLVTSVTHDNNEARITLTEIEDVPGKSAEIFGVLAKNSINVDMIIQSAGVNKGTVSITFTVTKTDLAQAISVLKLNKSQIGYGEIVVDEDVSKISVIGVGMRTHAGVAYEMFKTLAQKGINIIAITTSEIKVSVLIKSEYSELATRSLHDSFNLAKI